MTKTYMLCAAILCASVTSCLVPQGAMMPGQNQPQAQQPNGRPAQQPNGRPAQQPNTPAQQPNAQEQAPQGQDARPGNTLLGALANNAIAQANQNGNSLIGNLLASVTGSLTTTRANLVGTWTYTEPSVQFESENFLAKAGGTTAATRLEGQLTSIYRMVGIQPGQLTITFGNDGQLSYTLGQRTLQGTYTFDASSKTVTITTANRHTLTAFVTVSGQNMSLCFDSSRVLGIFNSISGQLSSFSSTLSNITSLSGNYSGMKTGFKFSRQQ